MGTVGAVAAPDASASAARGSNGIARDANGRRSRAAAAIDAERDHSRNAAALSTEFDHGPAHGGRDDVVRPATTEGLRSGHQSIRAAPRPAAFRRSESF